MRWVAVWRRNFLVWRKLVIASVLSNLADPLILLFGLGYGLGALLPSVEGMPYIAFFAAGTLCSATMFTASFESMFSGFSRMHGQKTWDAILYAPLVIDDVVAGEIIWAASKAWLSGATILAVAAVFGLAASPIVIFTLPVAFLVGLAFAACGLIMTVLAKNWDFFSFYMTLIMTPMTMISGVWLWLGWFRGAGGWLHAKLALGALLVGYHLWCGKLLRDFTADRNTRTHLWL